MTSLTTSEAGQAASARRKKRLAAFLFVVPLLLFIIVTFVAPIGSMLWRSVYHPTVAELIPQTLAELERWDDHKQLPDERTLSVFVEELHALDKQRLSGKLSEEFNRAFTGMSSVVKSTARRIGRMDAEALSSQGVETLLESHRNWSRPELWYAIERAGKVYTYDYYLTALDLELHPDDGVQVRQDTQIYLQLYSKTLNMALVITLLCALLGYPLAYYLAGLPSNRANLLLVLVLLPFWTSLLVRTTSWIALLQTNGVINSTLMGIGLISQPFEMLYTSFATVVAMTHILLPFMILPLYSVMRGIDPSYMRAALSLGDKPIPAFVRIYFPMTLPGLSAGALLVFIISVGYYITPALVGGTDGQMISNIIAFHMQRSNNWELAAALGSLLLGLILLLYWVYDRFVGASNIKLG
ncbi:ABC transporter permease [Pseudomonas chengduensis]|uniref:Putative spermidine/putrescine transport system permease protein n=1 Tax=Pseudomonas sihuiensis TaxID=1274359 RepID=A0A1H2MGV4_9PSED|nr:MULTISPECIES: ABC transporter permease [Pseudomonas]KQO41279.1 ABC transporter permease [Pseudomonas sp. Leaf83]MDH0958737.1 ABC transporter permease [Pseudomonas chengduensis]MDH1537323.1 ABC transporter permease [Pseudomonas chengduensis]MDH1623128.1 ABC transporter permease [Pseudomonas chengduensis]SDU92493.1 putative spermidine/putrescine transport system permease protein [Pseudomonas sihuiensis]